MNESVGQPLQLLTFYYARTDEEVARHYKVNPIQGLSSQAVTQRQSQFGFNQLYKEKRRTVFNMIVSQFTDVMILILVVAALFSGVLGELQDTITILVIVVLNALLGVIQEYRAEKALSALNKLSTPNSRVLRDGEWHSFPTQELVPGDIAQVEAGDVIPADMRLISITALQTDESAMTGESMPVEKLLAPLSEEVSLSERVNSLFKGTQIVRGRGLGIVVATGMDSELGRIAQLLDQGSGNKTPLQKRLTTFGKRLAIVVLMIALLLFVMGWLQGEPILLMIMTAISLAVAAIPEALPAVVAISLALGAYKMSRQHALIRRLPAVETLGSVTYICSDKTGTLTQNRMHVDKLLINGVLISLLDDGVDREGDLWRYLGYACSISNDVREHEGDIEGDPTELALFYAADAIGFKKHQLEKLFPRIAEIPFDSQRKCMTTLHQSNETVFSFCKGAPESVIVNCQSVMTDEGLQLLRADDYIRQAELLAQQGYRVLAIAYRQFTTLPDPIGEAESHLILLALVALIDPPRPEAQQAVADCISAGITPVMITGDHPATALAIAERLGIADNRCSVVTGNELRVMDKTLLEKKVKETRVYARVSPEQKIDLVSALQKQGEFVAMTGDGVNDAPALQHADIGVAMGRQGTEVAREAADMVLLDDNFATIVTAIREGRRIYDNIRKFVRYTMTSNAGEILTLLIAPLLGMPIPLLPIHILWINLVTDGLPGLALTLEKAEKDIMQRPPRKTDEGVFAHRLWWQIIWVGMLIGGVSLFTLWWAIEQGIENWQTMVFTVLTFSQLMNVMAIRSEKESLFRIGLFTNTLLLLTVCLTICLQLLVVYHPLLNEIFKTSPLTLSQLIFCILLSFIVFIAIELEKWVVRSKVIKY